MHPDLQMISNNSRPSFLYKRLSPACSYKEERVDREGSAGCPEGLRTRVSDRRLEGRIQRRVAR